MGCQEQLICLGVSSCVGYTREIKTPREQVVGVDLRQLMWRDGPPHSTPPESSTPSALLIDKIEGGGRGDGVHTLPADTVHVEVREEVGGLPEAQTSLPDTVDGAPVVSTSHSRTSDVWRSPIPLLN